MRNAGTFRVVYPIEALDGGLNNRYAPNIVADNESPDCLNVIYSELGGVQTRDGMKKFNTTAVGTFAGDGLFTIRFNDGTEEMNGWWNGSMFKLTGATTFTTVPSAQSVFTAGTRVDMQMYQNLAFFGNGGSIPYKYNGTEFTRMGVYAPNSGPTTASGTAGTSGPAGGDVQYKVSYVNSYVVEGDVGAATTTLTIASTATVSLTGLPVAPTSFGVAARKLYRKSVGSGGEYKLVTTISNNTATTYTDETIDASLGAVAPTDQGVPPNWQYAITHKERIFLVDPSQPQLLWYTELANPFVVKTTNFFRVSNGDGERISGLGIHADNLSIGKDAGVWLVYMPSTDPTDWILVKSNSKYGMASHYAQADYSELRMFIGKRYNVLAGFLALAGVNTQPDAVALTVTGIFAETQSDRIEPEVFSLATANMNRACAIEFKNKLWFSVPGTNQTINTRVFQFDFKRRDKSIIEGSWVPFEYPVGFAAFTIYGGKLYAQSSSETGFVYQLDAGVYNDDGTAIESYSWTKEYQGFEDHTENQKDFRFANFIVETLGAYYMNLTYRVDSDAGQGTTKQLYLSSGGSLWGTLIWGIGLWGGGQSRKKYTVPLSPSSGKWIQFKFDNQTAVNQAFHVLPNGSFSYNLRGKR